MKLIIGMTGATGAPLGVALLQAAVKAARFRKIRLR